MHRIGLMRGSVQEDDLLVGVRGAGMGVVVEGVSACAVHLTATMIISKQSPHQSLSMKMRSRMHVTVSHMARPVAPQLIAVRLRRSGKAARVASSRNDLRAAVTVVTPSSLRMMTMWVVAGKAGSVQNRLGRRPKTQRTRMRVLGRVRTLHGVAAGCCLS